MNLITKTIWGECIKVYEFLSWHSTWYVASNDRSVLIDLFVSKVFWMQYINMDGATLLEFALEKKKKNQELLHRTLKFEYKDNMIGIKHFQRILCTELMV